MGNRDSTVSARMMVSGARLALADSPMVTMTLILAEFCDVRTHDFVCSLKVFLKVNRLRVFRRAHIAHLGRGVGQEQWWRVGPSAKDAARCVSLWDAMRTRTTCCAPAPQRWTRCLSTHVLLTLPEGRPLTNTRNPFSDPWRVHLCNITLPWVWPRCHGDVRPRTH